ARRRRNDAAVRSRRRGHRGSHSQRAGRRRDDDRPARPRRARAAARPAARGDAPLSPHRLMTVELYGYRFSVYSWIACLALEEKGIGYRWIEVDPFADDVPQDYLALHPFKRVPALVHDEFQLYETGAITRYVDEAFPGPRLQPVEARRRARCNQLISIVDR